MIRNQKTQRTLPEGEVGFRPPVGFNITIAHEITRWFPLLLIIISFGVYFQNVFHEFTYDDKIWVVGDPRIWQWDIKGFFFPGGNRWPLVVRPFTFMIDYSLFGFSPVGFQLHNLFWHSLCVVLVFFLLKKLTQTAIFSFFGALIFAIHPIHVEAVSNITNRKELLALAFLLIAFLCYIRFLEEHSSRKWGWFLAAGLSWGLGLCSKQVTIILPLLLVAYEILLVHRDQRFLTKNIFLLLGIIGVGSLQLLLYAHYVLDITNFQTSVVLSYTLKGYLGELTYLALVATSARAFWTYIQLLVWPAGLCPSHVVDLSPSFLDFRALLAWCGLMAFIIITLQLSFRWPVLAFGMIWFLMSFIPISNWVPSAYILADRYMYMPSVGYCLVLVALGQALYGWLLTTRPQRAIAIAGFLAAALTVSYTSTTLAYNRNWSNQESLFTSMLRCNPKSALAHNGLGTFYFEKGMYGKAREHFSRSIALGFMEAYNNRGNAFYAMGEYQAALKDYNYVISLKPDWGKPYLNRGILSLAQKNYQSAVKDFTQALEKLPNQSRVFNARGLAYEKLGNWTKAQEDYTKAITSDPSNAEAFFNLGRVQLNNDELDAAILSYQKAKELGWEKADNVLKVLRKKGYLR